MTIFDRFQNEPLEAAIYLGVLLISFLFHEYGHAWAAIAMGDDTPTVNGRFSWNPLRYLNAVGILLILFIGFGPGGQVYTRPERYRNRVLGEMLVSSAGVLMNLALAVLAALALRTLGVGFNTATDSLMGGNQVPDIVVNTLSSAIALNVSLAVFNALPIPPLDGAHFLAAIVPGPLGESLRRSRVPGTWCCSR